jgi:hypothetical protein
MIHGRKWVGHRAAATDMVALHKLMYVFSGALIKQRIAKL